MDNPNRAYLDSKPATDDELLRLETGYEPEDTEDEGKQLRNWKCIVYLDSCGFDDPIDFFNALERVGVPMLVSPLHDRDTFIRDSGIKVLKKPHFHVMLQLTGKAKYDEVLSWMAPFGVRILKRVKDIRHDERYWCHLDSPNKYKYDIEDLVCIGGYECKYLGMREELDHIQQIYRLIRELGIVDYADLDNELYENAPHLQMTFFRYTAHFNNLFRNMADMAKHFKYDNGTYVKYGYRRRRFGN